MGDHIGEKIRRLREERNIGKVEMGRLLGTSYQMVTHIEEHEDLKSTRLLQIAQALNVPLSHFLGDQVREMEGQEGLSPDEQAWQELRRQLVADGRLEEAERLLHLDEDGRRLVSIWQTVGEDGRLEILGEAEKQAVKARKR